MSSNNNFFDPFSFFFFCVRENSLWRVFLTSERFVRPCFSTNSPALSPTDNSSRRKLDVCSRRGTKLANDGELGLLGYPGKYDRKKTLFRRTIRKREIWNVLPYPFFFFLHIFSIVFSCHFEYIDTIKIDEWLLLILFSFSPTNLDLYGYYDVWSIDTTFFVTKIKKEKRKVKRDINGKNRERKTSEKNNRIAYPRSRYLPSRR